MKTLFKIGITPQDETTFIGLELTTPGNVGEHVNVYCDGVIERRSAEFVAKQCEAAVKQQLVNMPPAVFDRYVLTGEMTQTNELPDTTTIIAM